MRILASDAATAIGGRLVVDAAAEPPDVSFDGASFDSRTIKPGELFVPLIADRDGHDFIPSALDRGCRVLLSSRDDLEVPPGATAIRVDDTADALMQLGSYGRELLDVPVVGVTGSVGKTSTKDLIAVALGASRRVAANEHSFNNEQGLPVTILGAAADTELLVVEMGMRGFGEIARLAEVAQPTIGVVTAVAASHTERVGGINGVARAKRELVEALPADGTAVLNADDARVAQMASHTEAAVITFGLDGDVAISGLVLDELARPRCHISSPWGKAELRLAIPGAHMATNAAAALAVTGVVEGSIDAAVAALETASISGRRLELGRTGRGVIVLNDAYNANPDSTTAALRALASVTARRHIAVLGPMGELDDAAVGHASVAAEAERLGVEMIAVDTELYGPTPVDIDGAIERLAGLGEGDAVLVKASNSARLWRVAERLLETVG